jgi:imidazolonepropionase
VFGTLLLRNCFQLLTPRGGAPKRGKALRELGIVRDGAVLAREGRIAAVGARREVERAWKRLPPKERRATQELDAGGRVALPGFVDSHTHLIHAASRANEYEMRIAGATYQEIARAGGGIASSVKSLRAAAPADLKQRTLAHLKRFAVHGTTTLEAKSGYGLDLASELKILRLHRELAKEQPLDIVSSFLGGHVPPREYHKRPDAYVELLLHKMIPRVAAEGLAEYCDVFCDVGAFTLAQARRILTAARACGLGLRLHAEQLTHTDAARLGAELHAASVDHLEQINAADIRALAGSDTTCTVLPGCCFHLGLQHYAPARALIEAGAIVALATDFNPGTSPTLSMTMILSLACTQMRMTPAEAIAAATINAAYSLGRADRIGSLEVGKYADIALFSVEDYREIPYYFGVNHCWLTLKRGEVVHATANERG